MKDFFKKSISDLGESIHMHQGSSKLDVSLNLSPQSGTLIRLCLKFGQSVLYHLSL